MSVKYNKAQIKQRRYDSRHKKDPLMAAVKQRHNKRNKAEENIDFMNDLNRAGFINECFNRKILCGRCLRQKIGKLFLPTLYPEKLKDRLFKLFRREPAVTKVEA